MGRVTVSRSTRNEVLRRAIREVWSSVAAFCRAEGFPPTVVGAFVNCKKSPVGSHGDYLDIAKRLSGVLGIACDELFPRAYYAFGRQLAVVEVPWSALEGVDRMGACEAVQSLLTPEDVVISRDLAEKTRRVLSALTAREMRVIERRFGLGGRRSCGDQSLEEVAADFKTTRERVH